MKKLRLYRIVVVLCLIGALITSTSCIRKKKDWGKVVSKNITVKKYLLTICQEVKKKDLV